MSSEFARIIGSLLTGRSARQLAKVSLVAALTAGLSASVATKTGVRPSPRIVATAHRATSRPVILAMAVAPTRPAEPSAFVRESAMNGGELMARWRTEIRQASRRFAVPEDWIRAVMTIESGGRTMMGENKPIASDAGAMGLMQVMPQTWEQMRRQYGLGNDPYDPHDNILAGTAYLRALYQTYDYPGLFAAYNDGPGALEAHRRLQEMMPAETTAYVWNIASILSTGAPLPRHAVPDIATLQRAEPAAPRPAPAIVVKRQVDPAADNGDGEEEQ